MNNRLYDDLVIFFCRYLWITEHPPLTVEDFANHEKNALDRYRNDPVFHAKVKQLTGNILKIVEASNGQE